MENTLMLSEEFKGYKEELKKCGLHLIDLDVLNQKYVITLTEETFCKLGRKCFPKVATETETKEITAKQYGNIISAIGFFHDRITMGYSFIGYIAKKLTCVSPDNQTRIVRSFRIEKKETY